MNYRRATPADVQQIALLHAESWRNSYRGMLSDEFLDREVVENRLAVWRSRLDSPVEGQFVLVAEENQRIDGFICVFGNYDDKFGALLDNLHIRPDKQRRGLGKELMSRTASWMEETYPESGLYLWVFASNEPAIRFYERLGAQMAGEKIEDEFGDKPVRALRYVWTDVERLMKHFTTVRNKYFSPFYAPPKRGGDAS
ncbi:MAG: GNAT family N-acetyltransferase [Ardenticatenaceae bacterium]